MWGCEAGGFARHARKCYIVTMLDPLSPTAGLMTRLPLVGGVLAGLWGLVAWALA